MVRRRQRDTCRLQRGQCSRAGKDSEAPGVETASPIATSDYRQNHPRHKQQEPAGHGADPQAQVGPRLGNVLPETRRDPPDIEDLRSEQDDEQRREQRDDVDAQGDPFDRRDRLVHHDAQLALAAREGRQPDQPGQIDRRHRPPADEPEDQPGPRVPIGVTELVDRRPDARGSLPNLSPPKGGAALGAAVSGFPE